ncbi:hypothetical protein [Pedobacter glucosidilyticus]|uniref:hypothetical protein n=1 Tax=Pedobacter glucosidilyticus TaxID=1122941 RepID=UPI0026EECB80|nr:hypothetical protein [Pedobacter glucosidilyticus]
MSLTLPLIIQSEAPQKPEEIYDFVISFTDLLCKHIKFLKEKVLANIKLILIEYCTNALKHVANEVNIIQAEFDNQILQLKKIDKAPKFKMGNLILSQDILRNYSFIEIDAHSFQFVLKHEYQQNEVILIPEHFGFEIVIRASKKFTYTYQDDTKENIFCATLTF